jgi:deoxycytidine triphosphate deaminase
MATLNEHEIKQRINNGELIRNVRRKENGEIDVEVASYDLMAGEAIWKDVGKPFWKDGTGRCSYDPCKKRHKQGFVKLKPGQMMFVVTAEDVLMPKDLCGTVYSRNSLSRDGILALNTGHIDPGFEGPIIIRLINLKSVDYTLTLGAPIFTIVFETIKKRQKDNLDGHHKISREETINRATRQADEALGNALYDLALLRDFVKKEEFGTTLWKWLIGKFWGIVTLIVGVIIAAISMIAGVIKIIEFLN